MTIIHWKFLQARPRVRHIVPTCPSRREQNRSPTLSTLFVALLSSLSLRWLLRRGLAGLQRLRKLPLGFLNTRPGPNSASRTFSSNGRMLVLLCYQLRKWRESATRLRSRRRNDRLRHPAAKPGNRWPSSSPKLREQLLRSALVQELGLARRHVSVALHQPAGHSCTKYQVHYTHPGPHRFTSRCVCSWGRRRSRFGRGTGSFAGSGGGARGHQTRSQPHGSSN